MIQSEAPFLVLLGWFFLGERPGPQKLLGVAIAFGGVALIAGLPDVAAAGISVLLVLSGAFMWAVGQAMIRKMCPDVGGFRLIAWVAVFASPQLFVMSLIFEGDHVRLLGEAGWVVWGTVIYLGLVMTALGYGIWYRLISAHPISLVGPFLLLLPVTTVAGGVLLLGEQVSAMVAVGGVLVLAGVGLVVFERGAGTRRRGHGLSACQTAAFPGAIIATIMRPTVRCAADEGLSCVSSCSPPPSSLRRPAPHWRSPPVTFRPCSSVSTAWSAMSAP